MNLTEMTARQLADHMGPTELPPEPAVLTGRAMSPGEAALENLAAEISVLSEGPALSDAEAYRSGQRLVYWSRIARADREAGG